MTAEKRSDSELLGQFCANGDTDAFACVLHRHAEMVFSVCRRRLQGHQSDTEDAAQAVFVLLWKHARALRHRKTVAGWLHRVACNVCRNVNRSRRAAHALEDLEMPGIAPHETAEWQELREVLDSELLALPEKYRVPLVLFHLEGRPQLEVAQLLGATQSAISKRLQRGRELLRTRLTRRGLALTTVAFSSLLTSAAKAEKVPADFCAVTLQLADEFQQQPAVAAKSSSALALAMFTWRQAGQMQMRIASIAVALALLVTLGLVAKRQFAQATEPPPEAEVAPVSATTLALGTITPGNNSFFEIEQQLRRQRVFVQQVRSVWHESSWHLEIPDELVGTEQEVTQLMRLVAKKQQVQVEQRTNSVGTHFLFYEAATDEDLTRFREAIEDFNPGWQKRLQGIPVAFDVRTVAVLAPFLSHEQAGVRAAARQSLGGYVGLPAASVLLPEKQAIAFLDFEYENGNLGPVIESAGLIGVLPLLKTAAKQEDPELRTAVARAVRYSGSTEALQIVSHLAQDTDPVVRAAAAEALGWLGGDSALQVLTKIRSDKSGEVRVAVTQSLGWHGETAVAPLRDLLQDPLADVRRAAVGSLGRIGSKEAVLLLGTGMRDEDYLVREHSGVALGMLGSRQDVLAVLTAASQDKERSVRWATVAALGHIRSNESLELLKKLVNDPEIDVQKRSVYHLSIFGEVQAIPLLRKATERHSCCHIQSAAAAALADIGTENAVPLLTELLARNTRADYWHVRKDIAYALGRVGSDDAIRHLGQMLVTEKPTTGNDDKQRSLILATRRGIVYALGISGNPRAVPLLTQELQQSDRQTRQAAINGLAQLGTPAAREALLRHLQLSREDAPTVRDALRSWLPHDEEVRKALGY